MTACARVLLAIALALILLPAAQAQTRKTVGPWGVVCSGGATGYCSASNRVKSVSGPYRFQLNVSRERPGVPLEVALLTGYQHPREGSAITVQVDAGKPLRLAAGTGYRRAGRSNTFVVAAGETERLLQQMRAGQRVRFRFEDTKGAAVDAPFSLSGLSGAMAFMDKMQPAPRVRAPAASAQAAAEQPAPADLKPAPVTATTPAPPISPPPTSPTERAPARAATAQPAQKPPAPASRVATPPATATATAPPPATSPSERAPARATAPAPVEKAPVPASPAAAAPAERQVTPAPVPAPTAAPAPREAAPTPAVAPTPAKEAAPAPPAPVAPARTAASTTPATAAPATGQSGRATAAAPVPAAPAKPVPAPPPAAEVAAVPAQKPAAEASRKPPRAQQQAAVSTAPSASRKRGARSIRQFSCIGNGPLWTLVIDGDSARYASVTDSGQRDTIELAGKLNVTGDGPTPVIDWRGKSDWGGSFRAQVSEESCRDSTSGSEEQTDFEYKVQVSLPGRKTVRGCCNAGLPPAPLVAAAPTDTTQFPVADLRSRPETDWSRYLFDLLPAIQACIDKTPEPEPYATKAWPMNQGMVGVRTRNSQGGWFECVADANGRSVERFIPLPAAAPPAPNENRVVFSPPDHPPIGDNCYKHERVLDGLGDFMGWLSTNGCS